MFFVELDQSEGSYQEIIEGIGVELENVVDAEVIESIEKNKNSYK